MIDPKPQTPRNEAYKAFVREQPCLVTGRTPSDPAHTGGRRGIGIKASDFTCVPLTREKHRECHQIGERTFQEKYNIDFREARLALMERFIQERMS